MSGLSNKNIIFQDLKKLLNNLGFSVRIKKGATSFTKNELLIFHELKSNPTVKGFLKE